MPSAAPPPEIIAQFARVSRSAHVAAYTLTVFEWLLCLPQEVKLIHKSRWTPAKAAYLFSRYFPLFTYPIVMWVQIAEHTKEECSNIYKLPMYLAVPNNFVAEILLTLRTYALTGGNKTIFGGLLGLLSSMIIYLLWMISVKTSQMPGGMACFPIPNGHKMYLTSPFVCMVAYDTLVTGIFIYFAMKAVRLRLAIADQVLKTLVREGFIYFICISAVNIINVGFNLQSNVAMATGAVPLSLLMCNVLACRLYVWQKLSISSLPAYQGLESPPSRS
ncbi:hypothetical protein BKA62DRAFT_1109 [Auriculariales sp. MPI-PUGE-AT-0066]|nr:hypothetical protein BKA62DRAFT_1109 [Auriculariales sp. MPI-PUGE-AT-0066]